MKGGNPGVVGFWMLDLTCVRVSSAAQVHPDKMDLEISKIRVSTTIAVRILPEHTGNRSIFAPKTPGMKVVVCVRLYCATVNDAVAWVSRLCRVMVSEAMHCNRRCCSVV